MAANPLDGTAELLSELDSEIFPNYSSFFLFQLLSFTILLFI